jgi:cytosine/adenosine deaminase-related metal-dependent hydrolase
VAAGRIKEVGNGPTPTDAHDLGDVAVLPGLINAHTHLEFSHFNEPIGEPGIPLWTWIGMVIAARGNTSESHQRHSIEIGMQELRQSGTILAGEIATPPCLYPDAEPSLIRFAEVVGLDAQRGAERLAAARSMIDAFPDTAVSPHAPYSTPRQLVADCVELARAASRPLAMHVAESPAERELLQHGSGPFADALKSLGVWQEGLFPWGNQPISTLIEMLTRAPSSLIVHGNDLQDEEIDSIARFSNLTVVYCPRTHHFFRYGPHPVARLIAAGVPVALGTDSRASNPDLDLWGEVQHLLRHRVDLKPSDVLAMATVHGARALGRPKLGSLEEDCTADLGIVETDAPKLEHLYADLATNDYKPLNRC